MHAGMTSYIPIDSPSRDKCTTLDISDIFANVWWEIRKIGFQRGIPVVKKFISEKMQRFWYQSIHVDELNKIAS